MSVTGLSGLTPRWNNLLPGMADQQAELYQRCNRLLQQWGPALLRSQVLDASRADDYSGIWCPADQAVHGRVGDAIYPFFHIASKTNDSRYLDAATLLYRWMDRRVSRPDGSWLNEPQQGSWQGTTVFSSIALGETLRHYAALMEPSFKTALTDRLQKAGNFIYETFNIDYGNINYPISATYGLTLLGTLLDIPKFTAKGKELARQALRFITPKDGFLFGEGDPYYQASKKGCFSVDLGYNVEESLSALVLYGLMTGDEEVLGAVNRALKTHMEFMLPDGGWDNSWGTRNYKWTYWGSRTSDGCQPAYALMADREPAFYRVALLNTQLMEECTHDGLLYGGPHCHSHGVTPCVHHTFSHIKALVTILDQEQSGTQIKPSSLALSLPREKAYGTRFFSDIQTCLVATGDFRATITTYDREYKHSRNGHASGGALTMLWHKKTGPLLTASMNEYQLIEAGNMQKDPDPLSMPLTPRIELRIDPASVYMNISCLDAVLEFERTCDREIVHAISRLVDKDQHDPPGGAIHCRVSYSFGKRDVIIRFKYDKSAYEGQVKIIVPVISSPDDTDVTVDGRSLKIARAGANIHISSNKGLARLPTTGKRLFNFVPGLAAIPLLISSNDVSVRIQVR